MNSPADGLADLRGETHAYSDPDSNSGYLVTVSELVRMGERPEAFFSPTIFGEAVEGGVGPDADIVAYSVLCPHMGFYMDYNADDRTLNCSGHFSRFDVEAGGQQVWGHATQNLPQFTLRVKAGLQR